MFNATRASSAAPVLKQAVFPTFPRNGREPTQRANLENHRGSTRVLQKFYGLTLSEVCKCRALHRGMALLAVEAPGGVYARGGILALGAAGACVFSAADGQVLQSLAWDVPTRKPVALAALAPGRWLVGDNEVGGPGCLHSQEGSRALHQA